MPAKRKGVKRNSRQAALDVVSPVPSEPSDSPYTGPCLLPLLQPVCLCLQPFLSAEDAARLMQASRSVTEALLSGYGFVDHIFEFTRRPVAAVKRTIALYGRYNMLIRRMCLPDRWKEPLLDSDTGQPQLPASLTALLLGQMHGTPHAMLHAAFVGTDRRWHAAMQDDEEGERQLERLVDGWELHNNCKTWEVFLYADLSGGYALSIPPGALPHGLRCLQFNDPFNQPLQAGSIPDTVEVLQFGEWYNQSLEPGHLPTSLTHLVLGYKFNQPLQPGVLPAGLRRLRIGNRYNQPLQPGSLPPQLQQLSLGFDYNHPLGAGVLPSAITHVNLGHNFTQPLQAGSIPDGVVHLKLSHAYNHPLLPGLLPASLRELVIGVEFERALQPGSLPDGLRVLAFEYYSMYQQPLQPGVLPASVVVVSLGREYAVPLIAGGIPATVKWLRLPPVVPGAENVEVIAPATTKIVRWQD